MVIFLGTMVIIGLVIVASYRNLRAFKRWWKKALVLIFLLVFTTIMQIGLITYGLMNNESLMQAGKGAIGLLLLVPATIIVMEIILLPLYTYLINRYQAGKITRKRFVIAILLILFLNDIFILGFYCW